MKKRITLWLLATLFLANVSLADAQQQTKITKIGWLVGRRSPQFDEYKKALRALGYLAILKEKTLLLSIDSLRVRLAVTLPWLTS